MRKSLLCALAVIMIASIPGLSAFAQDEKPKAPAASAEAPAPVAAPAEAPVPVAAPAEAPVPVAAPAAAPVKAEAPKVSDLSIYGEVQSINMQANSMTVQYYDYDNDEEKSVEITLDGNSKLENAKAIGDMKKGDWVDVTYTASAGKNVAKAVSLEKEEPAQEENAPAVE